MKQVVQKLGSGTMLVQEVPVPALDRGAVLVRVHYSLISAGTEGSTVRAARKTLIGKALERPQQARQVMDVLKMQGVVQTYRAVMKKLDAYSPLGYSCAGEVVEVGDGVTEFAVGDLVACGGLTASHAELVAVPVNLAVRLSPKADLRQAAYNALGAISLQGVRQADLRLGETCAVIGLGLLGQLTALLLRAAGVRVVGIDINPSAVELASRHSADLALLRDDPGVEERIRYFTGGLGCDAVIITAGSSSLDLINFGGAIARKRGTVVVVGAVPTGFDRDPHYYRKELQVRMSCSYGPGRYDPIYEEKGIDYPPGYVRWTEKRNMEAFQALLASGRLDVSFLTTHVFKFEDAPAAYDLMMERSEPFVGLLVEYEVSRPAAGESRIVTRPPARGGARVAIGFIGAGSYAQSHLLPNLPRGAGVRLVGVMTSSGTGSRSVADRFGFEYCAGDEREIFGNPEIDTVFVATRHDSHAEYVVKALQARKNVFVEKPLALTYDELARIEEAYVMACSDDGAPILMVGYNRRFSPLAQAVKAAIGRGPLAMTYRVNAGPIPAESWIQDPDVGGGRVVGEVCHFVDLLSFLAGAKALRVHAASMRAPGGLQDTLTANVSFEDGSIASLAYFANGDKALPKERLEVFANGCSYVLDDFRRLDTHVNGARRERKLLAQDKGQRQEVREFIEHVSSGKGPPIPFDDLWRSSLLTFAIHESLRTGHSVELAGTRPLAGARRAASA